MITLWLQGEMHGRRAKAVWKHNIRIKGRHRPPVFYSMHSCPFRGFKGLKPTTIHLPFRRFCMPMQLGQYHLPLGCSFRPTQSKWNHSILHCQRKEIIKEEQ